MVVSGLSLLTKRLFGFINNLSLGCTLRDLCVTFDIKAAKKTTSAKKKWLVV